MEVDESTTTISEENNISDQAIKEEVKDLEPFAIECIFLIVNRYFITVQD